MQGIVIIVLWKVVNKAKLPSPEASRSDDKVELSRNKSWVGTF